jgi:uncharacterized protein DUF6506
MTNAVPAAAPCFWERELGETNPEAGEGGDNVVRSYAFIFLSITEYSKSHVVVELEGCQARIVAVRDRATAARVAKELRDSGVQLIEFCDQCRPLHPEAETAASSDDGIDRKLNCNAVMRS